MTRLPRLFMCGYLIASLCGFLGPFCNLAFCGSRKDWVKNWMRQENEAFRDARHQEAITYYAEALEMREYNIDRLGKKHYNFNAFKTDPNLIKKQEKWVRDMVKSGKSANLLERIPKVPSDVSLPFRKHLIKTHYKELIIRASFLEKLVTDFNDFKVCRKGINIENAIVIGDLDFSKMEVSPAVSISKCIFVDRLNLKDSWFQRGLNLEGSHFLEAAIFVSLKVDHSAFFKNAVFQRPASFQSANIAAHFEANGARFESTADFNGCKLGAAYFVNAVFRGPVNFVWATIASQFAANEAHFENTEKEANFNSLKVDGIAFFTSAVFRGPASFILANVAKDFAAKGARFESKADFDSLKVGKDAFFHGTRFRGPVSFVSAKIASEFNANGAKFEGTKSTADFNGMAVVGGIASFEGAFFRRYADFGRVNMGRVYLTDTRFSGPVMFNGATIGDFHLERTKFRKGNQVTLEGLTYKNIYTEKRDYKEAVEILNHMERYQPQPYKQLESCYRETGYEEGADEVFVEGKTRELREAWNWLSWDLPTNFFKKVFLEMGVGYGRHLYLVFYYIFAIVALGTLVFSQPRLFRDQQQTLAWQGLLV